MEDQIINALPHVIPLILGLTAITIVVLLVSRVFRALGHYNRSHEERRR